MPLEEQLVQNRPEEQSLYKDSYSEDSQDLPSLEIDKHHFDFIASVGKVAYQNVLIKNDGNCAITFQWKETEVEPSFDFESRDCMDYFHIHCVEGVINPGQEKNFTFTFISDYPGFFHTKFRLQTHPLLHEELPLVKMIGYSVLEDENVEQRKNFDVKIHDYHTTRICSELIEDVVDGVRTPTPPPPDFSLQENREREFEAVNRERQLWYSEESNNLFVNLQEDLLQEVVFPEEDEQAGEPASQQPDWEFKVDKLQEWVSMVKDAEKKEQLQYRLDTYVYLCRKKPANRTPIYASTKNMLMNICLEELPPLGEQVLEDLGFAKKKFKNEEDEAKFMDGYKERLIAEFEGLLAEKIEVDDSENHYHEYLMFKDTRYQHDQAYIDKLSRIRNRKDIGVEAKKIMLKSSLLLDETLLQKAKYPPLKVEPTSTQTVSGKKDKKAPKEKKGEEAPPKPVEQTISLNLDFVKPGSLQEFTRNVRGLLAADPKLLFLLVSISSPSSRLRLQKEELSAEFLIGYLESLFPNNQFIFSDKLYIEEWEDKMENEVYNEGTVILFQNLTVLDVEAGYETIKKEIEYPSEEEAGQEANKKKGGKKGTKEEELEERPTHEVVRYRLTRDERVSVAQEMSRYTDIFIHDDPILFSERDLMSNTLIKPESSVIGRQLQDRFNFVVNSFRDLPQKSLLVLGGELTVQKLSFLKAFHKLFSKVILVGQFCVVVQSYLVEPETFQPEALGQCIRDVIKLYQDEETDRELILPTDFLYIDEEVLLQEQGEGEDQEQAEDSKKQQAKKKKGKDEEEEKPQTMIQFLEGMKAHKLEDIPEETVQRIRENVKLGYFPVAPLVATPEELSMISEDGEGEEEEGETGEGDEKKENTQMSKQSKSKGQKEDSKKVEDKKQQQEEDSLGEAEEEEMTEQFFKRGKFILDLGEDSKIRLIDELRDNRMIFWFGKTCVQPYWSQNERFIAKTFKELRQRAAVEEETMPESQRHEFVPLRLVVAGEEIISEINEMNLKDPKPARMAGLEEDEEDFEEEEEEEEESEEEEYEDEDLTSEEIRQLRRKQNIDQVADFFCTDDPFFLKIAGGDYFEQLDFYDQAKKIIVDPDDLDFDFLREI